ncbi:MAG: hypothetical protein V1822_02440 [Candidatus Micrarchaeota archaeon]
MEDFTPPKICPFCGGEMPTKKNASPSAPCTCNDDSDSAEIY